MVKKWWCQHFFYLKSHLKELFFLLAHLLSCTSLISALSCDLYYNYIPLWVGSWWHVGFFASLQVANTHSLLVIANKWIQGCMASSAATTNSGPIRLIFLGTIVIIWATTLFSSVAQIRNEESTWNEPCDQKYFGAMADSYYLVVIIVSQQNWGNSNSAIRWILPSFVRDRASFFQLF